MVSIEMPDPVAAEFRKAYEEQNLGLSVKLALENLTQRMPLLDLKMRHRDPDPTRDGRKSGGNPRESCLHHS